MTLPGFSSIVHAEDLLHRDALANPVDSLRCEKRWQVLIS